VLKKDKNILYLNFDDEVLKQFSLQEITEKFLEKRNVDYIFLDEIQNCKFWTSYIRKAYDTKQFKQIWIT
jgi:predicted AAA+ superfamily ATPase